MDTLFLAVTCLSLVLVLVMAIIVVRLLRDERRRSEARVAALVSMAAHTEDVDDREDFTAQRRTPLHAQIRARSGDARKPVADASAPPVRVDPVPARPVSVREADDFELRPSPPIGVAPMFAAPERSTAWGRRLAIMVPIALVITGAGIAFYPWQPDIAAPEPTATAAPPRTATAAPLELLSLRHTQQTEALTVTGLVQNPRTGSAVSKVFATAFVFSANGTFLASGRAALDFTTLNPGDESPFVVTVPVKGEVARYRIGFRGEDGHVIAHVDRRAGGTLARVNEERP